MFTSFLLVVCKVGLLQLGVLPVLPAGAAHRRQQLHHHGAHTWQIVTRDFSTPGARLIVPDFSLITLFLFLFICIFY